jgi:AAHS family 4-hydroxybenzoate transporter-like MFS transporter
VGTQSQTTGGRSGTVDLAALLDDGPLKAFHVAVIVCCAAVAFFDGIDTQSIGVAAPLIAKAFHLPPGALGPVFSAGQIGAMIGAIAAGAIADRFGRKPTLIVATLVMALGTVATAMSTTIPAFLTARLGAGLGLGAAVPCAIAMTAEFAPARVRHGAVSLMWAAFPLGGVAGGLVNPILAKTLGWTGIFYIGGLVPIALAGICLLLPESLRYLAARDPSSERVRSIVRRISATAGQAERFVYAESAKHRGSVIALLTEGRSAITLILWALSVITFSGLLFQPLWAPTMLIHAGGLTLGQAGMVVAMSNLGSVIGTAGFGRLFDRFGLGRVMVAGYALAGVSLAFGAWGGVGFYGLCVVAFASCLCLGGASGGVLNLAAASYPTALRSTGVGTAVSMARIGQIFTTLLIGVMLTGGWASGGLYLGAGVVALVAAGLAMLMPRPRPA